MSKASNKELVKPVLPGYIVFENMLTGFSKGKKSHHAEHVWLLSDNKDRPVAHAAEGEALSGVLPHTLRSYALAKVENRPGATSPKPGDHSELYAVFSCEDVDFREFMSEAATHFAPVLPPDILEALKFFQKEAKLKKTEDNQPLPPIVREAKISFTSYAAKRKADLESKDDKGSEVIKAKNIVRAVRACIRVIDGEPLSNIKGVNCCQFVAFCMQVAAIRCLMGDQVESFRAGLEAITKRKLKNCTDEEGLLLLMSFAQRFFDFVKELKSAGIMDEKRIEKLVTIVEFSAKGTYDQFFDFVYHKLQSLFKWSGSLVVTDLQGKPQAWEVDWEATSVHGELRLVYDSVEQVRSELQEQKSGSGSSVAVQERTPLSPQSRSTSQPSGPSPLRSLSLVTSSPPRTNESTSSCNCCLIL